MAGKELRFKGHIIENREATDEEVKEFFEKLNSHHCNGHCGCHKGEGDENNQCGCNGSDEKQWRRLLLLWQLKLKKYYNHI